jgi:hypothetical protein
MDPLSQNRQIMQWCRQHGVQVGLRCGVTALASSVMPGEISIRLVCLHPMCTQMVAYSTLGTQWGGVGPDRHNPVLNHPVLQVSFSTRDATTLCVPCKVHSGGYKKCSYCS